MKPSLLQGLEQRRPAIRERWAALLRLEKAPTALARPDTLVYLFDHTLTEVLAPGQAAAPVNAEVPAQPVSRCECNPYRHYFATLEQALLEALIWVQVEEPGLTAGDKVASVGELCRRMRQVAQREILLFDGVCPHGAAESREA